MRWVCENFQRNKTHDVPLALVSQPDSTSFPFSKMAADYDIWRETQQCFSAANQFSHLLSS